MPRTVPLDFLMIASSPAVTLAAVEETLAPLRLGMVSAFPPEEDPDQAWAEGRERVALGRAGVRETLGRVEATLVMERHRRAVMQGLGPDALARLLNGVNAEQQQTFRAGTISIDLRFTLVDADLRWCHLWVIAILEALGQRFAAVVFDPAAQRCQSPEQIARLREASPSAFMALHNEPWGPELRWLHTHGLQKFGQPELEIAGVPQSLENTGAGVLRIVAESLAQSAPGDGPALRAGMEVECEGAGMLLTRNAPTDGDHQAPYGRLRLVTAPLPGAQPGQDATDVICSAALNSAQEALNARDLDQAERLLDRILVAMPERADAVTLKARVLLLRGQPLAALELGTYLATRLPFDRRGPFVTGMALMALGRFMEALGALNQAVTLDPDDPATFEARARLNERLGLLQDAASDRARARMLRG